MMIKDRIVRVKMRKGFHEQRPQNWVGKVMHFSEAWLALEARCVLVSRSIPKGVQIDAAPSQIMIPRDTVESIRILPNDFDLTNIQVTTEGQQLHMVVKNGPSCYIGEIGEG